MSARVLIIDDTPASLELMKYLLEASGYAVMTATTGPKGIAAARRDVPDLVLCDVQLPGMDGMDVAREFRDAPALAGVPMVAVTAFDLPGDRSRLLAAGFDGYVPKPIEVETFCAEVGVFLSPTRTVQRAP